MPLASDEARTVAEAHYRTAARRFVTGEGVAEGDARIRVGAPVSCPAWGRCSTAPYYVTAVRHTFDPSTATAPTSASSGPVSGEAA